LSELQESCQQKEVCQNLLSIKKQFMFDNLFADCKKVFCDDILVRYQKSPDDQIRCAFKIRKKAGNAVNRNRIRRVIKEYVRVNLSKFKNPVWMIFFIRELKGDFSNQVIREQLALAFKKSRLVQ
jgi:ribonuclease P protein component